MARIDPLNAGGRHLENRKISYLGNGLTDCHDSWHVVGNPLNHAHIDFEVTVAS